MAKKLNSYNVELHFESFCFNGIKARNVKEAREKALARLTRKGLKAMVDKQTSDVIKNKYDF